MGIGLVNESFILKEAREAHKVCLQSLMTVQHQLEVYIELIVNFCASSAKKVVHVIVSKATTVIRSSNLAVLKSPN